MRIIAGQRRGMVLASFDSDAIRPTKDIVKEFIFNCLASVVDLSGCVACDLFAGTGGLGLEALSRGAPKVVFVDHHQVAIRLIEKNVDKMKLTSVTSIVQDDVFQFLGKTDEKFDLVLADPPYGQRLGCSIMEASFDRIRPGGVLVIEGPPDETWPAGGAWSLHKQRRWGESMVTIFRKAV